MDLDTRTIILALAAMQPTLLERDAHGRTSSEGGNVEPAVLCRHRISDELGGEEFRVSKRDSMTTRTASRTNTTTCPPAG